MGNNARGFLWVGENSANGTTAITGQDYASRFYLTANGAGRGLARPMQLCGAMISVRNALLILVTACALTGSAFAGDASAPAAPTAPTPASGKPDLQQLIQQFNHRRDSLVANHDALVNQLKTATAEQKKAILEKMAAEQKDLLDTQRAMAKQIRDEMRKLRQQTPPHR